MSSTQVHKRLSSSPAVKALGWVLAVLGLAVFSYNVLYRVWRVGGLVVLRLGYTVLGVVLAWWLLGRWKRWQASGTSSKPLPVVVVLGGACLFALTTSTAVFFFVFDGLPHAGDEVSYFLQAHIFARGQVTAPAPPDPEFFDPRHNSTLVRHGRWYTFDPPGNAFLLALGLRGGMLGIVNPLLLAAAVLAMYALGRVAHDASTGLASALLLAFAPGMVFMAGSLMPHTAVLALAALALTAVFLVERDGLFWTAALAGLAFGLSSLVRPLDGGLMTLASVIYLLIILRRRAFRPLAVLVAVFVIVASGYLIWNWAVNGKPFLPGYRVAMPQGALFGFGRNVLGTRNSLPQLAWSAFRNMAAYADMAWGWPLNIFLLLALYLIFLGSPTHRDLFLLALYGLFVAVFFFYYCPGLWLGARFFWPTYPGIAVLLSRIFTASPKIDADRIAKPPARTFTWSRAILAILFCALSWSLRFPAWAWYYKHDFWGVTPEVGHLVQRAGIGNGLIFLHVGTSKGPPHVWGTLGPALASSTPPSKRWYNTPLLTTLAKTMTGMMPLPRSLVYNSGMVHNTPWPHEQPVIYLLDRGKKNAKAQSYWPRSGTYMIYCDARDSTYKLCSYYLPATPPPLARQQLPPPPGMYAQTMLSIQARRPTLPHRQSIILAED